MIRVLAALLPVYSATGLVAAQQTSQAEPKTQPKAPDFSEQGPHALVSSSSLTHRFGVTLHMLHTRALQECDDLLEQNFSALLSGWPNRKAVRQVPCHQEAPGDPPEIEADPLVVAGEQLHLRCTASSIDPRTGRGP